MVELVIDEEDLKVWSNSAKDKLVERREDGSEVWRLYRDTDGDSVMESITVTRKPLLNNK